jgi:hypothetical protein
MLSGSASSCAPAANATSDARCRASQPGSATSSSPRVGSDFYDKHIDTERKKRAHLRQLEALGYRVTLDPAA